MGLNATRRSGPLTMEELRAEIGCHERPVVFSWRVGGDAGHIMVAYGYKEGNVLLIADPEPACEGMMTPISYDEYSSEEMPSRTHWDDYFGFEVK
jgi:hypothetical protein